MIAAIYARKSTDQNVADEEKSVARQVARARAYAERKGWTLDDAQVYVDDGISGADFVRRDGYLRLMNALKPRPPFQALVMMEQSRLGREQTETTYALKRLVDAGVRIFFYLTDAELKRGTAIDKFLTSSMAFVDEMHREQSRQRTRDAMRRHAERGHVAGGLVYGYRNVEVKHGDTRSHVVRAIDGEQAPIVQRIFLEIARGDGYLRIARRLNAEGIPSPRPGRLGWQTSGIREISHRDLYRGRLVYGRIRWEDRDGTKHKIDTPPSEWITVEVPDLRIIDDPLWGQAQARLRETSALYARVSGGTLMGRPGSTLESRYLLTGFLRCALCDGAVFVSKQPSRGRMLWYYICAAKRTGSACPGGGVRIAMERLDEAVLDAIEATLLTPERLRSIVARAAAGQHTGPSRAERETQLRHLLCEAQARVERYVRAIGDGLDLAEVRDKLRESKATVVNLEAQLAVLAGTPTSATDHERIERRVADWRGVLRRGPVTARQILRKILPGKRPVALTPLEGGGVTFKAQAAWAGLFAGTAYVSLVVPPG